jgi:hypothetical protein
MLILSCKSTACCEQLCFMLCALCCVRCAWRRHSTVQPAGALGNCTALLCWRPHVRLPRTCGTLLHSSSPVHQCKLNAAVACASPHVPSQLLERPWHPGCVTRTVHPPRLIRECLEHCRAAAADQQHRAQLDLLLVLRVAYFKYYFK